MSSHTANMTIKSKGCLDNIRAERALRFDIMKREKKQSEDWYRSILQGERHQYVDKSCPICMSSVRQKFYKCNKCLTKFGLKRHLIYHVMKTHMRNKEMNVQEGQKSPTFVFEENCKKEKKILQTINIKKSNNDVVKNKRPRKLFTCGICGETLTTSLILKTHLKSIHEHEHSIGTHTCLNIQYAVEILILFQKYVAMLCF